MMQKIEIDMLADHEQWPHRLLWFEPIWVCAVGLVITLPTPASADQWLPAIILALFIFWPLRWRIDREVWPRSPLDWSIILLLVWLPMNLWASPAPTISWTVTGYLLFGLALYVALANWPPTKQSPQWVAWFLLCAGAGLAIASPLLTTWKPQFRLFDLPLYAQLQSLPFDLGETIHANNLAGALVIIFPLLVSLAIQRIEIQTDRDGRIWWGLVIRACFGLIALIIGSVVVLTQSRGGYLALMVALSLVFVLRWPRLLYSAPMIIVIMVFGINQVGLDAVLNQLSSDGTLGGWSGRIDIWTHSLNALYDFVFTGIGIGTFTIVLPLLYPLRVSIESYPHTHNLFLQIGVDLGLPGLIAYLALVINLFVMLATCLKATALSNPHPDVDESLYWALAAGSMGSLVAMLVHGLLDAVLWGTKLAFIVWIFFALITALHVRITGSQSAFQSEHDFLDRKRS